MIKQSIVGMLTSQELEYLQKYARSEYSGQGEIVDLGCWLGSSTIPLAAGLKENLNLEARLRIINAYDIFIWEPWMDQLSCVVGTSLEGKYKPGNSFFDECLKQTRPWKKQIKFHPGDLTKLGWQGGPIEFLFIDAMKSWNLANSIIHDFLPALIPGCSVIVHQDFTHYYTYWIHLIMYRLKDYFEPIYDIPYSASLVFKYQKPIPDELLKASYSLASFSIDEINSAFNYSTHLVSREKRPIVLTAKAKAFNDLGGKDHKEQIESALADLEQAQIQLQCLRVELEQSQFQLQSTQAELEQSQFQLQSTQAELEQSQLQLQSTQAELEQPQSESHFQLQSTTQSELEQAHFQLQQAQAEIIAMQTSKFWKLRKAWFKVKNLMGLVTND